MPASLYAQLLAHLVGDYALQSDWMAAEKRKRFDVALAHGLTYSLPFLLLGPSLLAWFAIVLTHSIIDHYGLARYIVWLKNFLAPRSAWPPPFAECAATGYAPDKPPFLAVWLTIVVDNTMHLLCNRAALHFLP